jgi:O-antigen/teichoic acid export membrane protein
MAKSLKINYLLNLTNTITGIVFPIIAFPYAARIMLADGIGLINFYSSIINYIALFSCLGIPMYAIREIAKVRDDIQERNKITLEILFLHLGLTSLGYVAVSIIASFIPQVQTHVPLFLLLSATIILTTIGCEWFYIGTEDFLYITVRGVIVKSVSLIFLFVLVRTKEDIMWYALYTVIGSLGGNIFNFFRLRKLVDLKSIDLKELKPLNHLKPALRIFVLNLIISIYCNLNTVMLGFMKGNESVGLFTAATRLTQVILALVSSMSTVMLSRFTNLIANNQTDRFEALAKKVITFVVAITLPLMVGLFAVAPMLIPIFCGEAYDGAVLTLQLLSSIVVSIGLSNVLGIQILYPMGKENIVIISTAFGAVLNFMLNIILIPQYSQNGAAIATIVAEACVTIVMMIVGKNHIPIKWKQTAFLKYIISSVVMGIAVLYSIATIELSIIPKFLFVVVIGVGTYFLCLMIMKDTLLKELILLIRKGN